MREFPESFFPRDWCQDFITANEHRQKMGMTPLPEPEGRQREWIADAYWGNEGNRCYWWTLREIREATGRRMSLSAKYVDAVTPSGVVRCWIVAREMVGTPDIRFGAWLPWPPRHAKDDKIKSAPTKKFADAPVTYRDSAPLQGEPESHSRQYRDQDTSPEPDDGVLPEIRLSRFSRIVQFLSKLFRALLPKLLS